MGDSRDLCPHLDSIGEVTKEDLLFKSKGACQSCGVTGPNLWACLQVSCSYVGCGESFADHSTIHAQAKKHNLTVNLTTFRVWCYACEKEVFLKQRLAAPLAGPSPKFSEQDPPLPSHPLKAVPIAVADEGESESEDDDLKPRGLTGMKNLGNSCYMNAALQALSNCPPLTQFFLECGGLVRTDKKPALCKSYQKLVSEVWHRKRPSYVVPTSLSHGIKLVNPMFRGYAQQDTQEFLRCLMDQLHEELKEPVVAAAAALAEARDSDSSDTDEKREGDRSPSEDEFLSCDSSSDRGEGDGQGRGGGGSQAEAELLTPDEAGRAISEKERMKDRKFSWGQQRTSSEQVDEDADVDTAMAALDDQPAEARPPSPRSPSPCRTPGARQPLGAPGPLCPAPPVCRAPTRTGPLASPTPWGPTTRASGQGSATWQLISSEEGSKAVFQGDDRPPKPARGTGYHKPTATEKGWRGCKQGLGKTETWRLWAPGGTLAQWAERGQGSVVSPAGGKAGVPPDILHDEGEPALGGVAVPAGARLGWHVLVDVQLGQVLLARNGQRQVLERLYRGGHLWGRRSAWKGRGHQAEPPTWGRSTGALKAGASLVPPPGTHTVTGGHYIAYCQNVINGQWYEFDDQYVTEVHETVVQNAEAYVLFYRKSSEEAVRERQQVVSLAAMREPSLLRFYVSREWLNKFNTFAEPGPITNHTFLCSHGGIPPNKYHYIDDLVVILPQNVWEHLYNRFGGGPAVNHLYVCSICQVEIEALAKRRRIEIDTFIKLNKAFQAEESPSVIYCISMQWFREWEAFVKGKDNEPPGPIDNSRIAQARGSGHIQLKQGADYGQISEETWVYLNNLYGGGPEIAIRQSVAQLQDPESLHGEQKIEAETRAV
ncbi:ubiquitin carboxyl-terminal hydrolase 20 [Puma concolor]|uniref:Ubiquitin carboxyl-terminal hydrolase 20 n=1 Tax=Puma concolor TaxID=9696 RepID=A0A6P6H106_PUMCO|nr:ubiquitin carboxyl-terminal hydrolase 20 [Puma concolor]